MAHRARPSRRRRRLRWTAGVLIGLAVAGAGLGAWLYRRARPAAYQPGESHAEVTSRLARELPGDAPRPRFSDVTAPAGLSGFHTFRGARTSQLPEDMGAGAAWGDFDADGDPDLFLVSAGGPLDAQPEARAPSRLYENLGDGTFRQAPAFPTCGSRGWRPPGATSMATAGSTWW